MDSLRNAKTEQEASENRRRLTEFQCKQIAALAFTREAERLGLMAIDSNTKLMRRNARGMKR